MSASSSLAVHHRLARRAFVVGTLAALCSVGCIRTRTPSIAREAPAPAFSLADHTGKQVTLADLTATGPAIVMFYRGYW